MTQPEKLRLARHAALKRRADGDVLVLPERAIRVGGSGGEIMRLCEDGRSAEEVVDAMQARYPETPGIEQEVTRFLAEMLELGGLEASPIETESER